ncbi:MAG: S-methyl-5'-thioadenosine phosphorylase [Candidatus Hydrothermarchaeales archaeon]
MIAIIGGTGIYDPKLFGDVEAKTVETPYGSVEVYLGEVYGREAAFLSRHGSGRHALPPHKINYRANIYALKALNVERIISMNSVGTINRNLAPGNAVVPNDFIDITKGREGTFYDTEVVHVDLSNPYCPELRKVLLEATEEVKGKVFDGGVYACTQGPRFETPAEIRMLAAWGCDLVGMTGLPEAVLAREQEMCFASLCTVTNYAAGIAEKLTASEVKEVVEKSLEDTKSIIRGAVKRIPEERGCTCGETLKEARM